MVQFNYAVFLHNCCAFCDSCCKLKVLSNKTLTFIHIFIHLDFNKQTLVIILKKQLTNKHLRVVFTFFFWRRHSSRRRSGHQRQHRVVWACNRGEWRGQSQDWQWVYFIFQNGLFFYQTLTCWTRGGEEVRKLKADVRQRRHSEFKNQGVLVRASRLMLSLSCRSFSFSAFIWRWVGPSWTVLWHAPLQLRAQPQSVSKDRLAQTVQQREVEKKQNLSLVSPKLLCPL